MGIPSINIKFVEAGITAVKRGQRGIVVLVLKDTMPIALKNPLSMITIDDIPKGLSEDNVEQIKLAMKGYINPPKKVMVYVEPVESTDYNEALKFLEAVRFDYLVIPDINDAQVQDIATWIKQERETKNKKIKAVLPNCPADNEGVINFGTASIVTEAKTYTTKQYCSRIAGLLAGTPMTISATYAPLSEVTDCDHLTKEEMDTAIDSGKFILINDGKKVKVARAVNSFVTTIQGKGDSFKKCKLIDAMDMIHDDIKETSEDNYLGKYANSYDNKCLLISAISSYFDQLELDGILEPKKNSVFIDIPSQKTFLKSTGVDVDEMKTQDIKEANTKDKVFLGAGIKILDAIEDISFNISI